MGDSGVQSFEIDPEKVMVRRLKRALLCCAVLRFVLCCVVLYNFGACVCVSACVSSTCRR